MEPPSTKTDRFVTIVLLFLLLLLLCISLSSGSYPLTLADVRTSFREMLLPKVEQSMPTRVFWSLRLPRVLTALLSGMILGVAGGVYQLLFRSPLASPDLTGVASGASFGAALAIVLGIGSSWLRMGFAFCGGMLSLVLVLLLAHFAGGERVGTYILAGILISSGADAGLMVLKTVADPERQLAAIDFWTMGSLASVSGERSLPFFLLAVPVLILLFLLHRPATMLSMGNDECRSMGLSPDLWRGILLTLSTLVVSASVSLTGCIGFVGLIAPHITRFLFRRRTGAYLLYCGVIGGILLTVADLAAKTIGNGAELPVSIFTVAAGIPVLTILLCKRGRDMA